MKNFPIFPPFRSWQPNLSGLEIPRFIPWEMIKPHEKQARINHGQSLERLRQRGGLCFSEAVAVLRNQGYRETYPNFTINKGLPDEDVRWAAEELIQLIQNYSKQRKLETNEQSSQEEPNSVSENCSGN